MSDLIKSLEKSVQFLRERYPADHALLVSLETQLESLKLKGENSPEVFSDKDDAEG